MDRILHVLLCLPSFNQGIHYNRYLVICYVDNLSAAPHTIPYYGGVICMSISGHDTGIAQYVNEDTCDILRRHSYRKLFPMCLFWHTHKSWLCPNARYTRNVIWRGGGGGVPMKKGSLSIYSSSLYFFCKHIFF